MEQPDPSSSIGSDRSSVEATIEAKLDDGLRSLQRTADELMHEIAAEVWRAAGGDKDEARSRILEEISRDQALRSLIAHSDERFQALAVRTARLEDGMTAIAEGVREVRERLEPRGDGGSLPNADADQLRAQLADISRQFGAALETLAERDQAIVDAVRARVLEHGELITQETTRISRAMEAYVQHGVEAIGQLAGTLEANVATLAVRDGDDATRVREAIAEQMTLLGEQLQLMYERMALDTTSVNESVTHHTQRTEERVRAVGEYLHLLNQRVDVTNRDSTQQLHRTIDARVMGLARMMRSDAEALRTILARTAQEHGERLTASSAEQREAIEGAAREQEERVAALGRELDERLTIAAHEQEARLSASTDVRLGRLVDALEERLASISANVSGLEERLDERIRGIDERTDTALSGIARLIRADNETLARQIVADQEASKQALRSMKELQANLPSEVIDMVEQRFASLAESIERSNEMLAKRIDRMAVAIGEQHDNDIQVVIDRMGDAMHALASLGRGNGGGGGARSDPRIELE